MEGEGEEVSHWRDEGEGGMGRKEVSHWKGREG